MLNSSFLNLVVIGAMMAGTSSLYNYLTFQPELSFSYAEKEVSLFNNDEHLQAGLSWYKNNFVENDLKKGEVNPNYIMFFTSKVVPGRIYSLVSNTRLIYILSCVLQL